MKHLLSIIVPVYNVEKYLKHCLDTICSQTYSDFECILVDDGSKDNCGRICDEYAEKDERFIVIHQQNAGLSDARNNALKIAKGDLVAFVDSDDWLEPNMYERLISLLDQYQADIAMCSYQSYHGNHMPLSGIEQVSGIDFTRSVLKDEIGSQLWKFVYKRNLWDGIVSPARRHVQDMMVLHKVSFRAKKVVTSDEKLYFYNDARENNISNNTKNIVKNKMDRALAFFWRMDFAVEHGFDEDVKRCVLEKALNFSVAAFSLKHVMDTKYQQDVHTVRTHLKQYWKEICQFEDKRRQLMAWLIMNLPGMFPIISTVYLKFKANGD